MSIVMNQASVGTTASLVGYIPPAGYLIASGTAAVYLGTGTAVTTSNGYQVTSSAPLVWQNALAGPQVPVYAIASSTAATLSFSFGNGPAGQVIAGGTAALQLDHNAGDIQPVGLTAGAGNSGLASDAKHVHTLPLTSPGDLLTVSAGTALARVAAGAAGQVLGISGGLPAWQAGLALQASTGAAGTALINGTPNLLSWTVPNDGNLHRVTLFASLQVASAETGGGVQFHFVSGASTGTPTVYNANTGGGAYQPISDCSVCVDPGSTVTLVQSSALTGGTATVRAEIWGS